MLVAGTDVCGHNKYGQHRIISIVIGKDDAINSLRNNIKIKKIHMSKLSEEERKEVINKLDFRNDDLFALAIYVEKTRTEAEIFSSNKLKDKYFDMKLVHQHFDMKLLDRIIPTIDKFSYRHNGGFKQLTVECDSDMSNTIRTWGMKRDGEGKAYELADAVAYCHNIGRRINGCAVLDLVNDLRDIMKKDLLK